MNPHTGQIYHGEAEIAAAQERGEELVPLSNGIVQQLFTSQQQDLQQAKRLRFEQEFAKQQQARERAQEREANRRFVQRSVGRPLAPPKYSANLEPVLQVFDREMAELDAKLASLGSAGPVHSPEA